MWLFIPPTDMTSFAASAFAPASEASISVFTSQSPDIGLWVMSSETVSTSSPQTFKAWATGLQRASYQRRKSARRTSATGCSLWPTPTCKGSGNHACIQLSPERGVEFKNDLNQVGNQIGLWNAAKA